MNTNKNTKILLSLTTSLFFAGIFIHYILQHTHTFNAICVHTFAVFFILSSFELIVITLKTRKKVHPDCMQTHPFLCVCIFINFLIALSAGGFLVLKYTLCFTYSFLVSLLQTADKLDKMVLVAIITAIFTIITNLILKFTEYKTTRQNYLAQKREIPYQKFIECFYKLKDNNDQYTQQTFLNDLNNFSQGLTLWGSTKVVEKWNQFRTNSLKPDMKEKNLFILEEMMNEMRKDIGTKKVKKGNLLGFIINDIQDYLK